jgi:hypothetical protein
MEQGQEFLILPFLNSSLQIFHKINEELSVFSILPHENSATKFIGPLCLTQRLLLLGRQKMQGFNNGKETFPVSCRRLTRELLAELFDLFRLKSRKNRRNFSSLTFLKGLQAV